MEVEPVDPRSFQNRHCLVNIIKDMFNTEEHRNGADELLELVEQIKVGTLQSIYSGTSMPG
jgi:hypothetical protein